MMEIPNINIINDAERFEKNKDNIKRAIAKLDEKIKDNTVGVIERDFKFSAYPGETIYRSLVKMDEEYISALLKFDDEDQGTADFFANAVIAIGRDLRRVDNYSKPLKNDIKELGGSSDPEEDRNIKYLSIAVALLLDLIKKHPEIPVIAALGEDRKRIRSYAYLKRYGFVQHGNEYSLETNKML